MAPESRVFFKSLESKTRKTQKTSNRQPVTESQYPQYITLPKIIMANTLIIFEKKHFHQVEIFQTAHLGRDRCHSGANSDMQMPARCETVKHQSVSSTKQLCLLHIQHTKSKKTLSLFHSDHLQLDQLLQGDHPTCSISKYS